jgi:hypothetical protein
VFATIVLAAIKSCFCGFVSDLGKSATAPNIPLEHRKLEECANASHRNALHQSIIANSRDGILVATQAAEFFFA